MNKVIFADGTELTGFTLTHDFLIFPTAVDTTAWSKSKLKSVTIEAEDGTTLHYDNAEVKVYDSRGFSFAERKPLDVLQESIQSQLDYIAMMADVEL